MVFILPADEGPDDSLENDTKNRVLLNNHRLRPVTSSLAPAGARPPYRTTEDEMSNQK